MTKSALITGITGQDGSYLAEYLLEKDYEVWGLIRRQSNPKMERIAHLLSSIDIIEGDLTDQSSLMSAMKIAQPDEVYNLAAQSFVGTSWQQPSLTGDVTGLGVTRVLEAARLISPNAKILQASSSEMFGKVREVPQKESTPFHPRSPYGVAKVYGYWICVNYRESYDMHVSNSICFNHESPRRGIEFVTRKISHSVAKISSGLLNEIRLGNLESKRDWGHAKDYVRAMHLTLQQDKPKDYVISTGETHSVHEFLDIAFNFIGIEDWGEYVKQDKRYMRPAEVDLLIGDSSKIRQETGWKPDYDFKMLVEEMVQSDIDLLNKDK